MYRDRRVSISNPSVHRFNRIPSVSTPSLTFQKIQIPNVSMSSAAAAAALRSQPSSPTSVADVKTKRMLRSSISSARSQSSISRDLSRQRKCSSGSMSQRSFRDFHSEQRGEIKSTTSIPPKSIMIQQKRSENLESSVTNNARRLSSFNSERSISSSNGPTLVNCTRFNGSNLSLNRTSVNFSLPTESRPISPLMQRQFKSPLNMNPININASDDQKMVYDPNSRRLLPKAEISEFDFTNISSQRKAMRESFTQSNPPDRKAYHTVERNLEYELNDMLPAPLEVDKEKSDFLIQNEQNQYSNSPVYVQDNRFTTSNPNQCWISSFLQASLPNTYHHKRQSFISTNSAVIPKMSISRENLTLQINPNFKNEINHNSKYEDLVIEPNYTLVQGSNSATIMERSFMENDHQQLAMTPRKSALKYVLSPHVNDVSIRTTNEVLIEEPSPLKKKATGVSFDNKSLTVDEGHPKIHISVAESGPQTNHFVLDSGKEKTSDEPLKLRENEVMKTRPKLPYLGSVRLKKKSQEVEERCLASSAESFNYNLSTVPAALHAFPADNKSKVQNISDDQLAIPDLNQERDLEKIANTSICHEEHSSEKISIDEITNDSKNYRRKIDALQDSQEAEKEIMMEVSYISEDRKPESQNSLKILNANYSATSLTSPEVLKNGNSSSFSQKGAPPRRTASLHPEILHIPGAWETSTSDSDKSLSSSLPINFESSNLSEKSTVIRSINEIASGNSQENYVGTFSDPDLSLNLLVKPAAFEAEGESESESIYCDAVEYVSDAENSSSTRTSIIANSTTEKICIDSKPAIFPPATHSPSLNSLNDTTQNKLQRVDKVVDKLNPIETPTSGMIRTVRKSNFISEEQQSESKTDDNHTKNREKSQCHRPFSLPVIPQIGLVGVEESTKGSLIMGTSINSENCITYNPTISLKSEYRKSLGNGVDNFYHKRPTDKKIKMKDSMRREESSCHLNIRSPSSASKTSRRSNPYKVSPMRKAIKFRFSRLSRSNFSRLTKEKGTCRQPGRFTEESNYEKQIRSKFKSRFIDSSDEDITPNRKPKSSDSFSEIPKFPILQNYGPGISKKNTHLNKIRRSDSLFSRPTQGDESPLNSSSRGNRYNTRNLSSLEQPYRKQKGRIISILRKKKTSFNDNFRRPDSRRLFMLEKKYQSTHVVDVSNAHSILGAKNAENKSSSRPLHLSDVPITADCDRNISTSDKNLQTEVADVGTATKNNVKFSNIQSNSGGIIPSLDSSRKKKIAPLRKIFRLDK